MSKYSQAEFVPKNPNKLVGNSAHFTCLLCHKNSETILKHSKHITNFHKIKIRDYYDQFYADDCSGKCKYCNNSTFFHGIEKGYSESCNNCRSYLAKEIRSKLRNNEEKFNKFRQVVSENQKIIWNERTANNTAHLIHKKSSNTNKRINSLLSTDDRKIRFGWLNKLSNDEKEVWKNTIMLNTGMHKWRTDATDDQKQEIINKRQCTMCNIDMYELEMRQRNTSEFKKYHNVVTKLTNNNYKKYIDIIDPNKLRSYYWHLDHIFSVKAGFYYDIDPCIISSVYNLRIISRSDNVKKNIRCDITLSELLEKYNVEV